LAAAAISSALDAPLQPNNPIAEVVAVLAQNVESDVLGDVWPGCRLPSFTEHV
jgi:hypothetical protein